MSINEVRYLPECGSTNAYMKEHFEEFGPVGAVYTTNQTAGRGRLYGFVSSSATSMPLRMSVQYQFVPVMGSGIPLRLRMTLMS